MSFITQENVKYAAAQKAIETWLLTDALALPDLGVVLDRFAERLNTDGVPVVRATTHVRTLHPRYVAVTRVWHRGTGSEEWRPLYVADGTISEYVRSPLLHLHTTQEPLNVRVDRPHGLDIPMLDELKDEGVTHYILAPVKFSDGVIHGMSIATDNADGFNADQVAMFMGLLPALTLLMEIKGLRRVLPEILSAYVGSDPARRILDGDIHRGEIQTIDAAIMVTDLRGFTTMSNEQDADKVMHWLNRYFDTVVPSVEEEGGEVLKFIGDGVFAVFPVTESPEAASRNALKAACRILDLMHHTECDMCSYDPVVSLHQGTVSYGNIGAGDRLDFTAIGSDVNLVCRLERVCKDLDRSLVMSEQFSRQIGAKTIHLGDHVVHGFRDPIPVFGLADTNICDRMVS